MPHLITKSLFVDYKTFPKLAWWRWNNLSAYRKIKKLETEESQEQIIELGKTVENLVGTYLESKAWAKAVNLFPDIPETDEEREDDDDTWVELSFQDRIEKNLSETEKAVKLWHKLVYQPGFLLGDCYVRADYMLRNASGSYDLYEVKAKSHIRKEVVNDGEKEHIGEIEKCFVNDVSFQKYVIDEIFASWGLPPLEKVFVAHLNADYVKRGKISIPDIVKTEEVGSFSQITVFQWAEGRRREKVIDRDDAFVPSSVVAETVKLIQSECLMSENAFNELFPFWGSKYLEYFGKDKPFWTIYSPRYAKPVTVSEFHHNGIVSLEDITHDDASRFGDRASQFITKYKASATSPVIEKKEILERLSTLRFPVCFYDYESVSVPVPLLDGTSPYQQAVVQYSLHKLHEDGRIEHYGAVLSEECDKCEIVDIPELFEASGPTIQRNRHVAGSQSDLFRLFLSDIGSDISTSSFVVWFRPFENSRNKEIAKSYPEFSDAFLKINEATFDLYEIFSDYLYFDRGFLGSASIKKVLPVLVPSLSYESLAIWKGDKAMRELQRLIQAPDSDSVSRKGTLGNLLEYCRQDSLAMLKIYEVLLSQIS